MGEKEQDSQDVSTITQTALVLKKYKDSPADGGKIIMKVYDGVYNEVPEGVECAKGCSYCCHSRVEITQTEAKTMLKHIRMHFNEIEKYGIKKRALEVQKKLTGKTKMEKLYARIPCPLLGKQGECTIYESRPLMCRSAYSKSALSCQLAHENPKEDVSVPIEMGPRYYAEELISGILVAENNNNEKRDMRHIHEWLVKLLK